jgi:hypothetical protein
MKEGKTEQPPPQANWIDKARQVLSIPKAEIDRREAEWRKARARKKRS